MYPRFSPTIPRLNIMATIDPECATNGVFRDNLVKACAEKGHPTPSRIICFSRLSHYGGKGSLFPYMKGDHYYVAMETGSQLTGGRCEGLKLADRHCEVLMDAIWGVLRKAMAGGGLEQWDFSDAHRPAFQTKTRGGYVFALGEVKFINGVKSEGVGCVGSQEVDELVKTVMGEKRTKRGGRKSSKEAQNTGASSSTGDL